jgi:hypothetical protein
MDSVDKTIKLYNADSLEYAGSILVKGKAWEYVDVDDEYMKKVTVGMPVKAVMMCLINFNLVYDIFEE